MKKLSLLTFLFLIATSTMAKTRHWQTAEIEATSETNVSWKLWGEKTTIHYTIETADMIYFAEYAFKPGQHRDSHPPQIAINVQTNVAVEGRHVYVLDVTGKEVKLHIVKKTAKQ